MSLAPVLIALAGGADWPVVGGDSGGMRYSELAQIRRENVAQMRPAWTYFTGAKAGDAPMQATPILAEGRLIFVTGNQRVVALDPRTGALLWETPVANEAARSGHTRSSRGVAFWSDHRPGGEGRVFYGTPDGRLLSLDVRTGQPDARFGTVDLRSELGPEWANAYVGVSAAPTVIGDRVLAGLATGEDMGAPPADILAFDVRTGKRAWRFRVIPRPGEFGANTWTSAGRQVSGAAGPWSGFAADLRRGVVYAATGSAAPDFDGAARPGRNLFANCVLAIDVATGKRRWHFQTVRHDLWDYDNASSPVLCQVQRGGRRVDAVAVLTKTGACFVLDRETGKPLFPIQEVPAPASSLPGVKAWPSQPMPSLPRPLAEQGFTLEKITRISPEATEAVRTKLARLAYGAPFMPPTAAGTVCLPGYIGGSPWSGASFDPVSRTLFVNTNNVPGIVSQPADYRFLTDHEGYPGVRPPWGVLSAVRVDTGELLWRSVLGEYRELTARGIPPTGTPNLGGTLATAGGLVFVGATCDQRLRAFDARSGQLLAEFELPASAYAAPMTYQVRGRQYVVISASGGGHLKTFGFERGPEVHALVAFALPEH